MLRKIGKQGKINLEANKILKIIYEEKGIERCELGQLPELGFTDCLRNWALGFAHKKKRIEYYKCPDQLSSFNETILACVNCHNKIENNKQLTEEVFRILRK
jgi:hypothetical protein